MPPAATAAVNTVEQKSDFSIVLTPTPFRMLADFFSILTGHHM
jgi:hypothetical protein